MDSKAQTIRDMFSRIAPRYDLLNRALSARIDQSWRKKAAAYLPERSFPLNIVDLCAGTLDLTLVVLERNPDARITAVDFSEAMLRAGEEKIPQALKNQVELTVGDGMDLRLPPERYDAVVCGFGMRNIVDNGKALQEIRRILKSGGRAIILEFFRPTTWDARFFHATYGKWVIPLLGSWLSKDSQAYQYLFDSIQSYSSSEEFGEVMKENGFALLANRPLTSHVASIVVGEKQ